MSMERIWFHSVLIVLVVVTMILWLLAEKQNVNLQKENEQLILRNDSLHMLQIKTRKELMYSNNKIDSLHINLTYKNRRR